MGILVRLGVRLLTRFIYARFGKRVGRIVSGSTTLALGLLAMLLGATAQAGGMVLIGVVLAAIGVIFIVMGLRTPAMVRPGVAQPYQQQAYAQAQPYQQAYPQAQPYQQPQWQAAPPYPQQMNEQPYAPQNPYAQGPYPQQPYGQQYYPPQAPQSYPPQQR